MEYNKTMLSVLKNHNRKVGLVFGYQIDNKGIKCQIGALEDMKDYRYLSFGFEVLDYYMQNDIRIITSINILEVSFVKNPAQEDTQWIKIL